MAPLELVRLIVPALLAFLVVVGLDWRSAGRGLLPPGFAVPWRRALAGISVALVLWAGVTSPLSSLGRSLPQPDVSKITTPQLFFLHAMMAAAALVWFLLGFARVRPAGSAPWPETTPETAPAAPQPPALAEPVPAWTGADEPAEAALEPLPLPAAVAPRRAPVSLGHRFAEQFGFVAPSVPREVGLGIVLGVAAWVVVLLGVMAVGLGLWALGGEKALPKEPPALVPWIAGLPVLVRMAVSLSAGVVEEGFFRGFLQPRLGILASTGLFVLAHFSYGQPFMLVGIALLSLIYAFLVRWRQNIWPAMAAHALFDGVQLLVVIPGALKLMHGQAAHAAMALGFW
jgi:membrane protease YdiL (CAAX protease family)